jgi:hypothetical protein
MVEPPYDRLQAAESAARACHADASNVKALWTPNGSMSDIVVEVWRGEGRDAHATTHVPTAGEVAAHMPEAAR